MEHDLGKLIKEVELDAEVHDVSVHVNYDRCAKTLGASYQDDVSTIRYYVADTEQLMDQITAAFRSDDITKVDAFWLLLNTLYKI